MSRERATAGVPVSTLGPILIRARRRLGASQRDVAGRLGTLGAPASVSRHARRSRPGAASCTTTDVC